MMKYIFFVSVFLSFFCVGQDLPKLTLHGGYDPLIYRSETVLTDYLKQKNAEFSFQNWHVGGSISCFSTERSSLQLGLSYECRTLEIKNVYDSFASYQGGTYGIYPLADKGDLHRKESNWNIEISWFQGLFKERSTLLLLEPYLSVNVLSRVYSGIYTNGPLTGNGVYDYNRMEEVFFAPSLNTNLGVRLNYNLPFRKKPSFVFIYGGGAWNIMNMYSIYRHSIMLNLGLRLDLSKLISSQKNSSKE